MHSMKNFDTCLDARQLKLFLSLADTLSLTKTAEALGVGQSAISHALNKLREELGDPLFVRSGRGIMATPHTLNIVGQVREVMNLMEGLVVKPSFDPGSAEDEIVIAANEYQRDMLLPSLLLRVNLHAPKLRLRVVSIPFEPLDLIRDERISLMLTPMPPDNADVHSQRLCCDRQAIFFDPEARQQPLSESDFLNADYIIPELLYDEATGCIRRQFSPVKNCNIRPKIVVNTFSGLAPFLRGSNMLAPLPEKLALMKGFTSCYVPGTYHPLSIHLCWHERINHSPLHQWLIYQLQEIASELEDSC